MTLLELINLMKKQLRLMIFLPVACAVAVGAYAFLGMPDTYLATTSLYVLTVQKRFKLQPFHGSHRVAARRQ